MRKRKNACCHYFYSTLLLLSLNSSKKSTVRKENPKMPLFGINREKSHSTHNVSFFLVSWRAMLPFLKIVCRTRIPRNPGEQSGLFAFPLFYFICFSSVFPFVFSLSFTSLWHWFPWVENIVKFYDHWSWHFSVKSLCLMDIGIIALIYYVITVNISILNQHFTFLKAIYFKNTVCLWLQILKSCLYSHFNQIIAQKISSAVEMTTK